METISTIQLKNIQHKNVLMFTTYMIALTLGLLESLVLKDTKAILNYGIQWAAMLIVFLLFHVFLKKYKIYPYITVILAYLFLIGAIIDLPWRRYNDDAGVLPGYFFCRPI